MQVVFHKTFKKKYQKLPPEIQKKYNVALALFLKDRFNRRLNNHAVDKAFPDCRSINVTGDYRAIFYEADDTAVFITIGTHSDLYG